MKIVKPSATILAITPDNPLKAIEVAGRTCYKSEDRITDDSAEAFCRSLIKRGHESVLEHAGMTVRFVCDRGVSHELVRHRIASFSQESTRYCNYGKAGEVSFVEPVELANPSEVLSNSWLRAMLSVWDCAMSDAELRYLRMLECGASPQLARSVLPNSLKTEVVMTANMREWRTVLRQRTAAAAHPDMRHLTGLLLSQVKARIPVLFEDL